jgi:hypothetical protein
MIIPVPRSKSTADVDVSSLTFLLSSVSLTDKAPVDTVMKETGGDVVLVGKVVNEEDVSMSILVEEGDEKDTLMVTWGEVKCASSWENVSMY